MKNDYLLYYVYNLFLIKTDLDIVKLDQKDPDINLIVDTSHIILQFNKTHAPKGNYSSIQIRCYRDSSSFFVNRTYDCEEKNDIFNCTCWGLMSALEYNVSLITIKEKWKPRVNKIQLGEDKNFFTSKNIDFVNKFSKCLLNVNQ